LPSSPIESARPSSCAVWRRASASSSDAAHAAEPGGDDEPAAQRAAEALARERGERLVRALQDPLGPDVDPGPGGHLAVHHQPGRIELAERVPRGPLRHEVGVRDQHARGVRVGLEHADRLAGLHEQRFVVLEPRELGLDRVKARLVARCLADPAVDHEILRPLGDVRMQVVLQHPQRGLLPPAAGSHREVGHSAQATGRRPVVQR
jgi:hypothetical protein